MSDEQPEHIWYRKEQISEDMWLLICSVGGEVGEAPAEVAMNLPEWTGE